MGVWIESTDIFSNVFIRPLHGTLCFIKTYQSVNDKFVEHPQYFTFRIILWFYAILLVFVLYSHYGYSTSNEKLNGHQAFESLGLLGALTFSSNNTFHNSNNYQSTIVFYLGNHILLSFSFTFIYLNSWKRCCFTCCYYLPFLTKMHCLYFQPIRLQLRRYRSGYLWNRKLWRMSKVRMICLERVWDRYCYIFFMILITSTCSQIPLSFDIYKRLSNAN